MPKRLYASASSPLGGLIATRGASGALGTS
jgi:hypothetical protein